MDTPITDEKYGLSEQEANARLATYGRNALIGQKKTSLFIKFFMQFNDFMILVLLAAAAASFGMNFLNNEHDFADPIIILAIVILNAILGVAQEAKAEKALDALKRLAAPTAKVVRDGKILHIDASLLVPGDVIHLETGDYIPADATLISGVNLQSEESALTGESVPVEKRPGHADIDAHLGDRANMLFSGCSVTYGHGIAVVIATGMDTEVGRIADMIMEAEAVETPLQRKLAATGKTLGIAALGICAFIFLMGVLRHIHPFNMFMTSVSLAVAAIPEGLPAIVTIMLALGVQRMAKSNAIIRKLPAVESLGGATVICSDKTGTLTQNKMRVTERHGDREILSYAALCNNSAVDSSGVVVGAPTEAALVDAATAAGINKNRLDLEWRRLNELPFDSERKLMSTLHTNNDGRYLMITKGAPEILINRCSHILQKGKVSELIKDKRRELNELNNSMANKALRVIAVAYRESPYPIVMKEEGLIFAGLLGMIDPPREEVLPAVATCLKAGIKPVMITGDHMATAQAIAKKIGIFKAGDLAMTGSEMSRLDDKTLRDRIDNYTVFARVSPEHKVRIVKAFQKRGNVVAMTGDGVNDAPALKAADIGCAMGIAGTDVAKGAADMVLTDDNFATIVKAVREGRGIYANIRKAVHFLLSSNIGEIITIFTAILVGWAAPLSAIHLLWVNLVTDSLPAIALGMDPAEDDIMLRKPVDAKGGLFAGGLWQRIVAEGFMIGFLALCAFGIGAVYYDVPGEHIVASTMCFATLSISQLIHAFNMRSDESVFRLNPMSNPYLIGALIIGVIMQAAVIEVPALNGVFKVAPLFYEQWIIVGGLCLVPLAVVEIQKYISSVSERNSIRKSQLI
ncbi:MAG: calcium-translocating P-type ATPase, PMCA-type [Clostridiales bacterium]|jgi:Ca2+-transporting ATPase|nr:calcium-translocating P-type ATPase, PMCA-type [Clostridiales bacterium]